MPSLSSTKGESSASASGSSSRKKSSGSSSSKSNSSGQLNSIEKRIWQTAIGEPGNILTNDVLQSRHADLRVEEQMAAINSLLAKSLFTAQNTQNGLQYQALSKSEAGVLGTLDSDESMIFSQIREAKNEGIWTKQLKNRTNLHQTIMTRCLKSLEGKQLIKAVKSVKFPTRKIYMLAALTPSIELSGGPWYTDNEMDTVFINQLCSFLHKFISSKTWPRTDEEGTSAPLFLASHTSSLPTSSLCHEWLRKNQISSTPLKIEDVQSLLDVLVYDGKIEKIPCYPNQVSSERKRDRDRDRDRDGKKKSKRKGYESQSDSGSDRSSDSGSGSESGSESSSGRSESRSKSESGSDSERSGRKRSHKRKHSSRSKSSSKRSKHSKSRSKSSSRRHGSQSSSKRSRHSSKDDNRGKNSSFAKSIVLSDEEEEEDEEEVVSMNGGSQIFVYRAVRPFLVKTGWTEIPCGHCPVFNFCEPGGPVNAEGCFYLRDWIQRCKASDVDGAGERVESNSNGRISDIEDTANKNSRNGKSALAEEAEEEEEEDEGTSLNIPLGVGDQEYDDDYGEEI